MHHANFKDTELLSTIDRVTLRSSEVAIFTTYTCMCFLFNSVVYIDIYVSSKVYSILLYYKRKKHLVEYKGQVLPSKHNRVGESLSGDSGSNSSTKTHLVDRKYYICLWEHHRVEEDLAELPQHLSPTFSSSSLVHGPLTSSGSRTLYQRCWHWCSVWVCTTRRLQMNESEH